MSKDSQSRSGDEPPPGEQPIPMRAYFNASLSLLVVIGATLLKDLSLSVQTAIGAALLCPGLVTLFFTLYNKDLKEKLKKEDFKREARDFLKSRKCTWSLVFPAVLVWTINAYLAGLFGWAERQVNGEPVVLRVVPGNGVIPILDGTRAGNGETIALRLHYHGHSKDYPVKGAGVIYLGQIDLQNADEKKLQKELKEYLVNEGVPEENLDLWLTKWGAVQHLETATTFRVGDEVGIDLVCTDSRRTMAHYPPFHLSHDQKPIYLESLEGPNPCAPPV